MKDKKIYILLVISILIAILGISYAYFALNVIGNDTAKNNKIVTGNLELTFTDTSEITLNNILPGDSVTKTIKVTNTGSKEVAYNVGWSDYENGIINNELIIESTCKRLNSSNAEEGTCNNVSKKAITGSNVISNIQIEAGVTHEYTLTITFKETNKPQNYNKNKSFNGKLNITESTAKTVYCTFDGELTQGAEYVNGQYTYRYKQQGDYTSSSGLAWSNIATDGWGVQLTDKTSTDPVNSELCTYINDKPVVSMSYMFYKCQAASIDLSNFDTSNVTNMRRMFESSQATTLNVSNFDTSNATNMSEMFYNSKATTLDVSSFDTSKVTNMSYMFNMSQATTLDVSNFNTSNVTNMAGMFSGSEATTLDVSNFDTSKVTTMVNMFYFSQATTLDLSNFDTSKVTNMSWMFQSCKATTLDVSSFDTSNVTNMSNMFYNSTKLKTIYSSDKFNTAAVTDNTNMFTNCTSLVGGSGTTYDSTKVDKTYARIDGGTSSPGYFTDVSLKPDDPKTFSSDSWSTIINAVKNNNISKYNLGDTKTIDIGDYGTHTVRIANMSTPSLCSTYRFSRSACGFVLEFTDIITTHNMNPSGTYNGTSYSSGYNKDGWPASSMRTFINNDIYNALPSDLKSGIIDTSVTSSYGSSDSSVFISTDKLYLLSTLEIWADASGSVIKYDNTKDMTRQLDYYNSLGVSTSKYSAAIKNNGSNVSYWWLRSASSNSNYGFYYVNNVGGWQEGSAFVINGVSPAFRIG